MTAAKGRDGACGPGECSPATGSGNGQAGMSTLVPASSRSAAGVVLKLKLLRVPASVGGCPLASGRTGTVVQRRSPCTGENW